MESNPMDEDDEDFVLAKSLQETRRSGRSRKAVDYSEKTQAIEAQVPEFTHSGVLVWAHVNKLGPWVGEVIEYAFPDDHPLPKHHVAIELFGDGRIEVVDESKAAPFEGEDFDAEILYGRSRSNRSRRAATKSRELLQAIKLAESRQVSLANDSAQ